MNTRVFVVFHSQLHEHQYRGVEDLYSFVKVGDSPFSIVSENISSKVLLCKDMPGFVSKGKHWTESEFLISLYHTLKKDPSYLNETDYVGFMQYDHTIKSKDGKSMLDYLIKHVDAMGNLGVICFAPIDLNHEITSTKIAMDPNEPQKLRGDPLCYFPMIANFNKYYGTSIRFSDFAKNKIIPLCSSFVMSKDNFMDMMNFCVWAAERDNIDQYDPERKHRLSGGLMERYYGTWILLKGLKINIFQVDEMPRF